MKKITFKRNEKDLRLLAIYVAALIKEGIEFKIDEFGNDGIGEWVEVTLTGGF